MNSKFQARLAFGACLLLVLTILCCTILKLTQKPTYFEATYTIDNHGNQTQTINHPQIN